MGRYSLALIFRFQRLLCLVLRWPADKGHKPMDSETSRLKFSGQRVAKEKDSSKRRVTGTRKCHTLCHTVRCQTDRASDTLTHWMTTTATAPTWATVLLQGRGPRRTWDSGTKQTRSLQSSTSHIHVFRNRLLSRFKFWTQTRECPYRSRQ